MNESQRWSTYSAPTYVNVVVPATQDDIVATVLSPSTFLNLADAFRLTMQLPTTSRFSPKAVAMGIALLSILSQMQL